MNFLKKNLKRIIILGLIIVNLILYNKFLFAAYPHYGDIDPYDLNIGKYLYDTTTSWLDTSSLGGVSRINIYSVPLIAFLGLLNSFIPISLNSAQWLLWFFVILSPFVVYNFFDTFLKKVSKKDSVFIVGLVSFFYLNNLLLAQLNLYPLHYYYYTVLFFPLICYYILQKNIWKTVISWILALIVLGTSPTFLILVGGISMYMIFELFVFHSKKTPHLKYIVSHFLIMLAIVGMYITPFILLYLSRGLSGSPELTKTLVSLNSSYPLLNSIRGFMSWFHTDYFTVYGQLIPRNNYTFYNRNILGILLSFLPVFFIITYTLLNKKDKRYHWLLLFYILFIIACYNFFITFGFIWKELFRSTEKFIPLYLFYISLIIICVLKNIKAKYLFIFLLLFLLYNNKLYTGGYIIDATITKTKLVQFDKNASRELDGKKVLYFPYYSRVWLATDHYNAYNPLPILYNSIDYTNSIEPLKETFVKPSYKLPKDYAEKVKKAVDKYGIEKLIFFKKFTYSYVFLGNQSLQYKEALSKYYTPLYQNEEIVIYDTKKQGHFLFNATYLGMFQKKHATHYIVTLKIPKGSSSFVFAQNFNKNWKIYPIEYVEKGEDMCIFSAISCHKNTVSLWRWEDTFRSFKRSLPDSIHEKSKDGLNKWILNTDYIKKYFPSSVYRENSDGSMELSFSLYYKTQSYYYLGILISWLLFLITLIGVTLSLRKK